MEKCPHGNMKVFRFDDDTVIAKDQRDAPVVWHEEYGDGELVDNWEEWEEVPGDAEIGIHETEGSSSPVVKKTATEWAAEKGRGYLCTAQW